MKRATLAALALAMFFFGLQPVALTQEQSITKTNLKVGDKAPDFTLISDQEKPVKLSDYHGKKNVILAFYVLAFTGG